MIIAQAVLVQHVLKKKVWPRWVTQYQTWRQVHLFTLILSAVVWGGMVIGIPTTLVLVDGGDYRLAVAGTAAVFISFGSFFALLFATSYGDARELGRIQNKGRVKIEPQTAEYKAEMPWIVLLPLGLLFMFLNPRPETP